MHSCRWPVCACGGGRGFEVRAAKATCEGGGGAMWGEAAVGQPGLVSSSKVSSHKTEILRRMRPPLIMQCVNSLLKSGCCSREFLVICRSGTKQRALLYLPATIHSLPCCKQQRAGFYFDRTCPFAHALQGKRGSWSSYVRPATPASPLLPPLLHSCPLPSQLAV